jgi:hypothetical protein
MRTGATVELVSPVPGSARRLETAPLDALAALRAGDAAALAGWRIGLVDNSKTNAVELLCDLRDLLVEHAGCVAGPLERKEVSGPLAQDAVERLAAAADLVFVASAD